MTLRRTLMIHVRNLTIFDLKNTPTTLTICLGMMNLEEWKDPGDCDSNEKLLALGRNSTEKAIAEVSLTETPSILSSQKPSQRVRHRLARQQNCRRSKSLC